MFKVALILSLLFQNTNPTGDSLVRELKKTQDPSTKASIYYNLAKTYYGSDQDLAIAYADSSISFSSQVDVPKMKANAINIKAVAYLIKSDFETSMKLNLEALKIRETIQDTVGLIESHLNIGNILYRTSKGKEAIERYKKALGYAKLAKSQRGLSLLFNNIGSFYRDRWKESSESSDLDSAKVYLIQSMEIKTALNDSRGLIHTLNQLSELAMGEKRYMLAESYLNRALEITKGVDDGELQISLLTQLTDFNIEVGDKSKALTYALSAFETAGLEARLAISSRPPLNLGEQIRALKAYPYGCLEQTTSGLYPSLYADAATLKRLGVEAEPDEQRKRSIELGIERLLSMQRYNGSFGLWGADSDEEYWLTAYVSDFLLRAREQGFGVPEEALKKANERLLRYLQERQLIEVNYSDNAEHSRFAVQAYAGYVLARSQQAPLGALRTLFERRSDARSGLPLVHLAVALQKMGDQPRADDALLAGLAIKRDDQQWFHDYGSVLRDDALILALLNEHSLASKQRDERLFGLADELAGRPYLSTQERNALFLAGRGLLGKPEAAWKVVLDGSGGEYPLSNEQPALALEGKMLSSDLSLRNQGSEPVYQQLTISGYPAQAPLPGGENLSIRREYLGMNGQPLDLKALNSGDLVLVHIAVNAKQRVPDALVVDLLPAGLELENQNLAQSAASLENASSKVKEWRESMQNASLKHQEFRDDRYVAALNLDGYGTTHLLYLARAVTPGTYRVPPPQVESMYRPNWQALGETVPQMVIKGR